MKHIKKFNNGDLLDTYKKSNFVTPHLYLNNTEKSFDYMPKYRQLEYISSTKTGGQYIDLGCQLMENTDDIQIDIKFNIKGNGKASSGTDTLLATLIGSQPEISPWPGWFIRKRWTDTLSIVLQTKWAFTNSQRQQNQNKWHSKYLSHCLSSGWTDAPWKNIYEFTETLDNIPASQVNNCTCTLFCAYDGNNNPFRFAEADLYYLKFTKGGQVVRNLIPVKKPTTGEIGLYDIENDHLYVSQGDDPFIAGPTI